MTANTGGPTFITPADHTTTASVAPAVKRMRVLGHIHTFNHEKVIERSVQALLSQTYPVEEILIVDNGSMDGTLEKAFPARVTVSRHPENLGCCGSVARGFQYALDKGYDWVWVFDADTVPHRSALQSLIELYESFSAQRQAETWLVASLPVDATVNESRHGVVFTARGPRQVEPDPGQLAYQCDVAIWTGSLYKLAAIPRVGLPPADYVMDGGDWAYGYRGKQAGFTAFMHQGSIVVQDLYAGADIRTYRVGPLSFRMFDIPPMRCYYRFRNSIYFWLYEYRERPTHGLSELAWLTKHWLKLLLLRRWPELSACARGAWDGLAKNLHHRYKV